MSVTSSVELLEMLQAQIDEDLHRLITAEVLADVAAALEEAPDPALTIQLYLCPRCGRYGIHSPPDCGHW